MDRFFHCPLWPIIQSSQWLHLRLSSRRRVCSNSSRTEVTVDSRLQVKMNSLDGTRNNSPRDHQHLSELLVLSNIHSCFTEEKCQCPFNSQPCTFCCLFRYLCCLFRYLTLCLCFHYRIQSFLSYILIIFTTLWIWIMSLSHV